MPKNVRNIAIIAHVDHGKTTLVDGLLKQTGSLRRGESVMERAMDSNALERERGITILSKCTSVAWQDLRINLVDTPGHADFGGEVERVLGMVDSVALLVDAAEGPMPQTRFVTQKAFELGLPAIVVINKIDRTGAAPDKAVEQVFDLFADLHATDEQLEFSVVYTCAREGYALANLGDEPKDLSPLLDLIAQKAPPAAGDIHAPLCMQIATLDYDKFIGYMAIGRVAAGRTRVGERVLLGSHVQPNAEFRVQKILQFQGLRSFELEQAEAGDIVALTGMNKLTAGDTITSIAEPRILPALVVDAPTMSMEFRPNDGPLAGTDGQYITSRHLRERLMREIKSNIALRVDASETAGVFKVSGRGELHLAILIETMRREGYELCVSQPEVIFKTSKDGKITEPYENVVINLEEAHAGNVIEEMGRRMGQMIAMSPLGSGRQQMEYRIPARGLIGYRSHFLTSTRGTGTLFARFAEYGAHAGTIRSRQNGVLISQGPGQSNAYSLYNLQDRGTFFIGPQVEVYGGMIVGENSRRDDLVVNATRGKKLTNIRTQLADEKLALAPPRPITLEYALEFISDNELVEVTPKALRLRKTVLDHNERKRQAKRAAG